MLHPSDLHPGWQSALRSLAMSVGAKADHERPNLEPLEDDGEDAEREAFHLDDTELAYRLVRDRSLIRYSTPPHARLLFSHMVQP